MKNVSKNLDSGGLSTKDLAIGVAKTALARPIILVVIAALIIGLGLYLNWPTIVGLGFAPLIFTLAPCALMCALGLCGMSGSKVKGDSKPPSQDDKS